MWNINCSNQHVHDAFVLDADIGLFVAIRGGRGVHAVVINY
jgi:hypothetical protein